MARTLRLVVVGAGRLGRLLAGRFSAEGHEVVVVDPSEAALEDLPAEFTGFKVAGDAGELDVLRQAAAGADVLLAVTRDDNLNLMVAQAARELFGVEKVVARIFDPVREKLYARLGIATVNPYTLAAEAFADRVAPEGEDAP